MKLLFSVLLLGCSVASAQNRDFPMAVNSASSGDTAASAPASGVVTRSGKDAILVNIHNSCFGTNLRGVGNPLSPNSIVTANVTLTVNGKDYPLMVKYPGDLVTKKGLAGGAVNPISAGNYNLPGGGSAAIYGNVAMLKTLIPSEVSVDSSGNVKTSGAESVSLKTYTFSQEVSCVGGAVYGAYGHSATTPTYPCGEFMGKTGTIAATFGGLNVSSDKSVIDMYVSFPGQTGFCGGYWSPLMVFFDDQRPKFDSVSSFPLNPTGKTMWPEAGHVGYFVAIDRDGSGKIDQKNELFGDNADQENGFEVLRKFDSNKDGVIDKKDKEFDKLVLWQDKNGDGISQPEEIVKLSSKVEKISLKYEKGNLVPIGKYAEQRERSKFWYKENGKRKEGQIVDMWFAPAPPEKVSQK